MNDDQCLIGKYGAVLWKTPIDPSDAEWYNGNPAKGLPDHQCLVCRVIADDGDVLTVYSPERAMKFFKKDFTVYETPALTWGDKVSILDKGIQAEVVHISWHFNNHEYFYFVSVNDKRLKKRYFISELKKI
jgi:hypothetical protein